MPQQVKILAVVFAVIIAAMVAAKSYFVPDTFGELGHYRAAAVDSIAALPIHYAGEPVCVECHDDIVDMKAGAKHVTLSCEVCHGPAAEHVDDLDTDLPMVPRKRDHCALCHQYNPARPNGFPQVDLATHNTMKPCISCHDPHEPQLDLTEAGCGACHGEIARTKMVSHHSELACIRCHDTPDGHRTNPRQVRPDKPAARDFCGGCHARGADAPAAIPRINLADHEPKYVCWQCHYPHHPEAK